MNHREVKVGHYYRVVATTLRDSSTGVAWKCMWTDESLRDSVFPSPISVYATGDVVLAPDGFSSRTFFSSSADQYEELSDEEAMLYDLAK